MRKLLILSCFALLAGALQGQTLWGGYRFGVESKNKDSVAVFNASELRSFILAGPITVAGGGTGRSTSTTAYGLIAAGTTATGAHQTLAAGATTEILVGGGASALPVWTTATGTGAPVRATSPTLVTPALGTPASGNLANCVNYPVSQLSGTLSVAGGGTGATTLTGLLQGNGTSAVTAITNSTTVGQTLRVTGSNTYGWGALDLADADAVTGSLPYGNGGRDVVTGRVTAQTATVATIATVTVGGSDASYMVSGNIVVTTSSAESLSLQVSYTDENSNSRTCIIPIIRASNGAMLTATISATGAVPYPGIDVHIRCKAGTAITIGTVGTVGGCTYNADAKIERI